MFEYGKPNDTEGLVASDDVWRMFQKLLEMRARGKISKKDSAKAVLQLDVTQANANNVLVHTRLIVGKTEVGRIN